MLAAAHIDQNSRTQNGLFYAIRVSAFLPEVQLLLGVLAVLLPECRTACGRVMLVGGKHV